jgi:hypothetical protein
MVGIDVGLNIQYYLFECKRLGGFRCDAGLARRKLCRFPGFLWHPAASTTCRAAVASLWPVFTPQRAFGGDGIAHAGRQAERQMIQRHLDEQRSSGTVHALVDKE